MPASTLRHLLNRELREVFDNVSITSEATIIVRSVGIYKGLMVYMCNRAPAV
jgi:hypothetical protein